MISLRYHIVSVMAVFLALGLGILLGASVVSTPLESRLHDDLNQARDERGAAKAEEAEAKAQLGTLTRRLSSEVGPWAVHQRLADRPFVFFSEGPQVPKWREHVLDALVAAGAQSEGTILLTERWSLEQPGDEQQLVDTVSSVVPSFDAKDDAAVSALTVLGERFLEPTGRALVDALARDGFMTVQGRSDQGWPPPGAALVVLSASRAADASPPPGVLSFARAASKVTPLLVATDAPDVPSTVGDLRSQGGLPKMLATFDSATNDADPGGIGVVAAMLAATESRGGHFGAERGRTFVAPAGSPT